MRDFKEIIFYNPAHSGDVFMSRGLVRIVSNLIKAERYIYDHYNSHSILKDMSFLSQQNKAIWDKPRATKWFIEKDSLYVNSGYMVFTEYFNKNGTSFNCLSETIKGELFDLFNINITCSPIDVICPIDFSKFNTENIDKHMNTDSSFKIYFANNDVLSRQAPNFNMDPIIDMLSSKYPKINFFITNFDNRISKKNVIYTNSIIGTNKDNLIENAYISTKCDIIIGRGSGPQTVCLNSNNIEYRNKIFIGIANGIKACEAGLSEYFSNNFYFTNNFDTNFLVNFISKKIERKKSENVLAIKKADIKDIESFLKIYGNSSSSFRYFLKRPSSIIKNHLLTIIGNQVGINKPVAYGHLDQDENKKTWLGLCVAEKYINNRYGRTILGRLLEHADNNNLDINLSVDKNNIKAKRLYQKFGFYKIKDENNNVEIYHRKGKKWQIR